MRVINAFLGSDGTAETRDIDSTISAAGTGLNPDEEGQDGIQVAVQFTYKTEFGTVDEIKRVVRKSDGQDLTGFLHHEAPRMREMLKQDIGMRLGINEEGWDEPRGFNDQGQFGPKPAGYEDIF